MGRRFRYVANRKHKAAKRRVWAGIAIGIYWDTHSLVRYMGAFRELDLYNMRPAGDFLARQGVKGDAITFTTYYIFRGVV